MTSAEIMDSAVGAYQACGKMILRYTAVPTLLSLAAVAFVFSYVLPSFMHTSNAHDVKVQVGEAIFNIALGLFVAAPLFVLGLCYSGAFVTSVVSDFMVGSVPDPEAAAAKAKALVPRLVGLALLEAATSCAGLIVSAGLLIASALKNSDELTSALGLMAFFVGLCTFPIVLCRHALNVPIAVIENAKPLASVKRSVQLLKAYGYQVSGYNTTVGMLILAVFLSLFIAGGINGILSLLNAEGYLESLLAGSSFHDLVIQSVQYLPWFLVIWTVVPVWCTTATILYYERRTRLEGYDIEALALDIRQHAKQNRFEL
jgi:hypothetical protein